MLSGAHSGTTHDKPLGLSFRMFYTMRNQRRRVLVGLVTCVLAAGA